MVVQETRAKRKDKDINTYSGKSLSAHLLRDLRIGPQDNVLVVAGRNGVKRPLLGVDAGPHDCVLLPQSPSRLEG